MNRKTLIGSRMIKKTLIGTRMSRKTLISTRMSRKTLFHNKERVMKYLGCKEKMVTSSSSWRRRSISQSARERET